MAARSTASFFRRSAKPCSPLPATIGKRRHANPKFPWSPGTAEQRSQAHNLACGDRRPPLWLAYILAPGDGPGCRDAPPSALSTAGDAAPSRVGARYWEIDPAARGRRIFSLRQHWSRTCLHATGSIRTSGRTRFGAKRSQCWHGHSLDDHRYAPARDPRRPLETRR